MVGGRRGQSAVEFALTLPLLFALTLGIVDVALLTFSLALARGAATDAALSVSEVGAHTLPNPGGSPLDADLAAARRVRRSPIASLGFVQLRDIRVCKLDQELRELKPPLCNSYDISDPTAVHLLTRPWDPATRVDTDRCADYFDIHLDFTYNWVTGGMLGFRPLDMDARGRGRLEPLSYDAEGKC